jgi:hypothetical protein
VERGDWWESRSVASRHPPRSLASSLSLAFLLRKALQFSQQVDNTLPCTVDNSFIHFDTTLLQRNRQGARDVARCSQRPHVRTDITCSQHTSFLQAFVRFPRDGWSSEPSPGSRAGVGWLVITRGCHKVVRRLSSSRRADASYPYWLRPFPNVSQPCTLSKDVHPLITSRLRFRHILFLNLFNHRGNR